MNIAIVGGGNMGTLMAAEFAHQGHNIKIYSRRPNDWSDTIEVYGRDDKLLFYSSNIMICSELDKAVRGVDMICITTPASTFDEFAKRLEPLVNEGQTLFVVPGSGGAEFAFYNLIQKGMILLGMQRVHSISRLKSYGQSVYMLGRKEELHIGTIPAYAVDRYKEIVENLFSIKTDTLPNYLNVTLTPSNPILHTARLYALFHAQPRDYEYADNPLFYEEWDDESSEVLLNFNDELMQICDKLPLDVLGVISLRIYYESDSIESMTAKIRNMEELKGLGSPMCKSGNGWKVDWNSRYFTADFPFGLKILIDIAKLFDVETPEMNKVWKWYLGTGTIESVFEMPVDKEQFIEFYK